MDYKVVKAKIIIGGRTIEQIREIYKDQGLDEQDFENIQRAGDQFHGAVAVFRTYYHDNHDTYYLVGWEDQYDQQMMMGMYYSEQTNPFSGEYVDNLDRFIADWKSGEFDPGVAFGLAESDVEVIEILK